MLRQIETRVTGLPWKNSGISARGGSSPLLADEGLAAALEAQARKSPPVPVSVDPDGVGRYPQESRLPSILRPSRPCRTSRSTRMPGP